MNELAYRLKKLRLDCGLTQSELARKLNITTASISKYELGTVIPDVEKLIMYGKIFQTSVDYLVGLSKSENENVKPIEYSPADLELLELFKQLPNEYKCEVKGYIKGLLSSKSL